ncbi:hypothetical protein JAAARDRAFT_27723 [Jaapia argillacea MUCL 33604]|uniref:Uncharacterized protein n=1 Tax=Jaapia argillacea MUCL 33604 TaxID=933084 RepID=A0A067QGB4_9AGAM|nr:hypothetical protein JAAARDRAFT_27723 [Jaapia argillacea MUCL 33604]
MERFVFLSSDPVDLLSNVPMTSMQSAAPRDIKGPYTLADIPSEDHKALFSPSESHKPPGDHAFSRSIISVAIESFGQEGSPSTTEWGTAET